MIRKGSQVRLHYTLTVDEEQRVRGKASVAAMEGVPTSVLAWSSSIPLAR